MARCLSSTATSQLSILTTRRASSVKISCCEYEEGFVFFVRDNPLKVNRGKKETRVSFLSVTRDWDLNSEEETENGSKLSSLLHYGTVYCLAFILFAQQMFGESSVHPGNMTYSYFYILYVGKHSFLL